MPETLRVARDAEGEEGIVTPEQPRPLAVSAAIPTAPSAGSKVQGGRPAFEPSQTYLEKGNIHSARDSYV